MTRLTFMPNLSGVDEIYQWLVDAHAGLSDAESIRLNSRLILLLINIVGDPRLVREAIDAAVAAGEIERSLPCT
jgi:hypothetical protein